jgi:hypothetical protein
MPYAYLRAAGIAPINIIGKNICGAGNRFDENTVWVEARYRRRIVQFAGDKIRRAGMTPQQALEAASMAYGIRLVPHATVMKRVDLLSQRLDTTMKELARNGVLQFFHREYARHRREQIARGLGFMSFTNARKRFRAAVIQRLVGLHDYAVDANLLSQVFDSPMLRRGLAHESEQAELAATELKKLTFLEPV